MFTVEEFNGVTVLSFPKEAPADLSSQLRDELRNLFRQNRNQIILDLRDCMPPSSSMLSVFLAAWEKSREMGGKLVLCNLSKSGEELIQVTDLGKYLETFGSLEEALKSFQE